MKALKLVIKCKNGEKNHVKNSSKREVIQMNNDKRLMKSAIEGNNISVGILLNKGADLNFREGNGYWL